MDAARPISNIIPMPPKRDDAGAHLFGRKNSARQQENQEIGAYRNSSTQRTAPTPEKLRDIQPTFTSTHETNDRFHLPYSAQFLAQHLGQQEDAAVELDPTRTYRQAVTAYDYSLGLTATIIGFDGRADRIA